MARGASRVLVSARSTTRCVVLPLFSSRFLDADAGRCVLRATPPSEATSRAPLVSCAACRVDRWAVPLWLCPASRLPWASPSAAPSCSGSAHCLRSLAVPLCTVSPMSPPALCLALAPGLVVLPLLPGPPLLPLQIHCGLFISVWELYHELLRSYLPRGPPRIRRSSADRICKIRVQIFVSTLWAEFPFLKVGICMFIFRSYFPQNVQYCP